MQITRQMLFPLAFYKKTKFTGSKGDYNYRLEKIAEEGKEDQFLLSVWRGPDCYDITTEEKEELRYSFSEEGMEQIIEYLNRL